MEDICFEIILKITISLFFLYINQTSFLFFIFNGLLETFLPLLKKVRVTR